MPAWIGNDLTSKVWDGITYPLPISKGCSNELVIFKLLSRIDILSIFVTLELKWKPQDFTDGSGNGLVLSGTKPLTDPILTKFYVAI